MNTRTKLLTIILAFGLSSGAAKADFSGAYEKWPRLFEQRPEYFKWNLC